ncbi:SixA phosphatase family protein [Flavisolibacter nicotianae]|uniref:SixA phosphatase family protein n=1 Tax=Flavisolibacter nicotianae TaxID=2364882 RepID=UPI000EB34742|nr:histidine phosphatase family protein [Flavisolibacter nicotianae]
MKTLILIRHAKSSWDAPGMSDSERPLNDRGKKDAPEMAKRLRKRGLNIDAFVSSPAERAFRTARYFAKEFDEKKDGIIVEKALYGATPEEFAQVIASLKEKFETVALFSHNPGITEYINTLCTVRTDNMPTCGIFAVQAAIDDWSSFARAEKSFLFYDYPKNPLAAL